MAIVREGVNVRTPLLQKTCTNTDSIFSQTELCQFLVDRSWQCASMSRGRHRRSPSTSPSSRHYHSFLLVWRRRTFAQSVARSRAKCAGHQAVWPLKLLQVGVALVSVHSTHCIVIYSHYTNARGWLDNAVSSFFNWLALV